MTTLYGSFALEVLTSNAPDFEELDEGQQAKYNHATCHMGEDTKQRLYVKNVDGAYLWHCHNCGTSGHYRPRETVARIKLFSGMTVSPMHKEPKLPPPEAYDYNNFPLEAQMWLLEYGFDEEMCHRYGIACVDTYGVILPIHSLYHKTQGYQVRRFNKKPKYMTYTSITYSWLVGYVDKPLVIVEDLLSSYKLHAAGYSTLCLLGTKIDSKGLTIVKSYDRVVIWLDDDAAGHAAGMKIYKEISPLVKNVTSINMQQPKEIPLDSLKTMEL